ncbi:MAG: DMT family transporter [Ilumatobacteraceae bacterium]
MRIAPHRLGWWSCAAAAVCFGAATPATKLVIRDAGPLTLAGLLYLGAAIAVLPFQRHEHSHTAAPPRRGLLLLTVTLGGGVAPVLLLLALHRTTAGTVSLLLNLELVATVVVARLFLHEHIGRRTANGIVLVVAGGVIVTGFGGTQLALGAVLVAGACVCWGIDNAITASLDRYTPATITLTKGMVAGTVNLVLGLAFETTPRGGTVIAALAIGSIGYGLSITLWVTGARQIGAARGQVVFALAPFVGAAMAWPLVGEHLRGRVIAAFVVSLFGVLIVATSSHRHRHTHQPIVHEHTIDPADAHHLPGTIEVLDHDIHRHLVLDHEHDHLPDVHHRHVH